jgi:hypothetical protein
LKNGYIGIGNYVYVNQSEMSLELRITPANASRAIKRLVGLGILLQGPKSGKNNTYMVSPAFCFKGSLAEGQKIAARAARQHKAKIIPFQREPTEQGGLL